MRRGTAQILTFAALLLPGCSLGTFELTPCASDNDCIKAIGPNWMCSSNGYCDPGRVDTDETGQETGLDPVNTDVVVNEILAKNGSTNQDELGQFEDWVELYNKSETFVDISGWGLSDEPDGSDPWFFPEGTAMTGGGYILVWADSTPEQGPLHANFKISADGEDIVMTDQYGRIVDKVTFGPQPEDISHGRVPDGSDVLVDGLIPTPGSANPSN